MYVTDAYTCMCVRSCQLIACEREHFIIGTSSFPKPHTHTHTHTHSFEDAISFARSNQFYGFPAVGGGSVMDTAKAANLYQCHPEAEFLDFVNPPVGKGMTIAKPLKPLICGESQPTGYLWEGSGSTPPGRVGKF